MAGTREGGQKAAVTREQHDPGSLSRAGEKGGHEHSGKQALETRARNEGKSVHDVAAAMGRAGGKHSHGERSKDSKQNEEE